MRSVTTYLRRTYSLEAELAIVALTLVTWHAIRIPIEGDVATSLAHAADVISLEETVGIDVEQWLIAATDGIAATLAWLYTNVHLPVLFGFVAAVRLLAPDRYPLLRTTFLLSFVPAALVIWLYPLAPPHWLPEFGFGVPPTDAELTNTSGALFHNTTAAAASQHFGFALFVAAASIWLFPRSILAWATIAYPVLVFVVIVGTGNHYVVDCMIGTLTFVLAAAIASKLVPVPRQRVQVAQTGGIASVAIGYALVAWGFVSLNLTSPTSADNVLHLAVLAVGVAAVVVPRLVDTDLLTESS
ncbi:MAG TPA: phosphatase PAP2 family protein [Gaiellaceae bacterium]|nr:phosphatase PAP2 family protein [Gaiellaceae bacterium]